MKKMPAWRRASQTIGIVLILVIFPILSWYFLQSGLSFTKDKFDQLDSLGQVTVIPTKPIFGQELVDTAFYEHMLIVGTLRNMSLGQLKRLDSIYLQLDDRSDLLFFFHNQNQLDYAQHSRYNKIAFWQDSNQVYIVQPPSLNWSDFCQMFYLPDSFSAKNVALVDTKGICRKVYNLEREQDRDLLVSHIVLLLPKE